LLGALLINIAIDVLKNKNKTKNNNKTPTEESQNIQNWKGPARTTEINHMFTQNSPYA